MTRREGDKGGGLPINIKVASKRGASPSFFTSPSPYQGEGDKGDRVTNKNLKGWVNK
jgi:hypothetical protein